MSAVLWLAKSLDFHLVFSDLKEQFKITVLLMNMNNLLVYIVLCKILDISKTVF